MSGAALFTRYRAARLVAAETEAAPWELLDLLAAVVWPSDELRAACEIAQKREERMRAPTDIECATGECGCDTVCAQDQAFDAMRDLDAQLEQYPEYDEPT